MATGAVLKYPGSKGTMTDWIVGQMPAHQVYVEPFFGSGSVFFAKAPSKLETINDLDGRVVNLFRVIRERPDQLAYAITATPFSRSELETANLHREGDDLEQARRFLVWCHQQIGVRTGTDMANGWRWTKDRDSSAVPRWRELPAAITAAAERLRLAQIEQRPALDVIKAYDASNVLIYADPPYEPTTVPRLPYLHTMTTEDHSVLLDALNRHSGPVLLSGYRCDLYDDRLRDWRRIDKRVQADNAQARTESLWLNCHAIEQGQQRRLPLGAA